MSTSISLIRQYFTEEQKRQVVLLLAEKLDENHDDVSFLAELVSELDVSTFGTIHPKILAYAKSVSLNGDHANFERAILLLRLLDKLCEDFLQCTLLELKKSMGTKLDYISSFQLMVELYGEEFVDGEFRKTTILNLFAFLSMLFSKSDLQVSAPIELDKLLCLFLGHTDESVATSCSKLVRWRIERLVVQSMKDEDLCDYLWSLIFKLIDSGTSKFHISNAYILWLRTLSNVNCEVKKNDFFQSNYLTREFYWEVLQTGLADKSHEIRKFCLSILQLSLKSICTSFTTPLIVWDMKLEDKLLREWSRYTTLYEILGIDTSLHQTQAAVNDIIGIIHPDSLIHPSWGFCLLATGFQASMDSVRKFSMQILLSIPEQYLYLLQYGLPFLTKTYLPYMMLSRHFAARRKTPTSRGVVCEYGEKFSIFLSNILKNLRTELEFEHVCSAILGVLERSKESFDAVRVYATLGLIRGIKNKKVLKFGIHDSVIVKLFDNYSEGDLFRQTIQTLNLLLLLHFQIDDFTNFASILTKFTNFNGFKIFREHIDQVSDFVVSNDFTVQKIVDALFSNAIPDTEQIVILNIVYHLSLSDFKRLEPFILEKSDSYISKLLASGLNLWLLSVPFKTRLSSLLDRALSGDVPLELYDDLFIANFSAKDSKISSEQMATFYQSVAEQVESEDYGELVLVTSKLRFLSKCVTIFGLPTSIDLTELIRLKSVLFINSSSCALSVSNFYKIKEDAIGEYHRLLAAFVSTILMLNTDFSRLLSVLNFGMTHPTTLHSICHIMLEAFENNIVEVEDSKISLIGLAESVAELDADKFKLTEKDVHFTLIRVFCHPVLLRYAIHDSVINDLIAAFCETMLFNSQGRRGLFTRLTEQMINFQTSNPREFEELPFLPGLLVQSAIHRQLQSNAFKLEGIIGKVYDEQISSKKEPGIYKEVYGDDEVSSKVRVFAILNSIKSAECAKAVLDFVFDPSDNYHFFNIIKATDGLEEYTRSQLAKVVISVIDVVDVDYSFENYFHHFVHFIENDPSPLVRVYFEWAIALHLLRRPKNSEVIFEKLTSAFVNHEVNPTLVTVYERILYLMVKSMSQVDEEKYLTKLAAYVIPAASTNKAVTRHFSMSLAISMYEEVQRKQLNVDKNILSILANMHKTALAQEAYGQYRSGDALLWNIIEDYDLVNISGGLLMRLNDRDVEFITSEEFHCYLTSAQQKQLNHHIGENKLHLWVGELKFAQTRSASLQESSVIALSPLQTKSGAWNTVMDVDESDRGTEILRSDLIVVASLVDKAPNLGGICRLCDVLGAGLMTLHDLKIKNNAQFKTVAVTADYWMPMIEVKPHQIVEYLHQKKADGYTLIGLEQTDKSVVLNKDLQFPKKSLILLGREKEGIPGELLAELDLCVEIKQVGIVRSMNIQTATAVIVHAYASQNC